MTLSWNSFFDISFSLLSLLPLDTNTSLLSRKTHIQPPRLMKYQVNSTLFDNSFNTVFLYLQSKFYSLWIIICIYLIPVYRWINIAYLWRGYIMLKLLAWNLGLSQQDVTKKFGKFEQYIYVIYFLACSSLMIIGWLSWYNNDHFSKEIICLIFSYKWYI